MQPLKFQSFENFPAKVDEYGIDLAPGQLTSISIQLVSFKHVEPIKETFKSD